MTRPGNLKVVLVAALFSLPVVACASPGDTLWVRTYDNSEVASSAKAVCVTEGGDCVFVSPTSVVKVDSAGDTLWVQEYSGYSGFADIEQTADGGYIVAASWRSGWLSHYAHLLRIDADGDSLWGGSYTGNMIRGDVMAHSVDATSDGGCALAASSFYEPDPGEPDPVEMYGLLVKTDAAGVREWSRKYGSGDVQAFSMRQTSDGGYVLAGSRNAEFYLIKADASGDTLWTREYQGLGFGGVATSVVETQDGGYALAGYTKDNEWTYPDPPWTPDWDLYLLKTDSSGDVVWAHTYGGPWDDIGNAIGETADGGFVAVGYMGSNLGPPPGYYPYESDVTRVGGDGCKLWSRAYGGPASGRALCVAVLEDGGYIVGGRMESFPLEGAYLMKVAGGEESMPPGSSECNPLVAPGGGADQDLQIPWPDPEDCSRGQWRCGPENGFPEGLCVCVFYICPPYVDHFLYTIEPEAVADSVTFGGVVVPTSFAGTDIRTSAGDDLEDPATGYPIQFSPGVTSFVASDLPLLLDLEAFEGDEFPLGVWFTSPDSVDVAFRVRAFAESTSSIHDNFETWTGIHLSAPIPNPATRAVMLTLSAVATEAVEVRVMNAAGRVVRELFSGTVSRGKRELAWDLCNDAGDQVASGVYFIVADGAARKLRKMVVIR